MKLPDDKAERLKVLILIAVGCVGVLYALIAGVVKPVLAKKELRREQIAEIREKLDAAQRDMDRMMRERNKNLDILSEIVRVAVDDGHLLQPRLGNYELGAKAFIQEQATAAGVRVDSINEIGIMQVPANPANSTPNAISAYNLRIGLQAGLHDLVALLDRIEVSNPYICISRIQIGTRAANPAEHTITFELQWPVWSDPDMAAELQRRLTEAQEYMGATRSSPTAG